MHTNPASSSSSRAQARRQAQAAANAAHERSGNTARNQPADVATASGPAAGGSRPSSSRPRGPHPLQQATRAQTDNEKLRGLKIAAYAYSQFETELQGKSPLDYFKGVLGYADAVINEAEKIPKNLRKNII